MITLHAAPARLRAAIVEYLYAMFFLLRRSARADEHILMPEFTPADLLRLNAPIRMDDLYAGCFLAPRRITKLDAGCWQQAKMFLLTFSSL